MGEERDEWIARLRELARSDADELVPRPAFDVYGLAAPELTPIALANTEGTDETGETSETGGELTNIVLAYGDWAQPAGPWVMVSSVVSSIAVEPDPDRVRRFIAEERNRLSGDAGIDEEEPAGSPEHWAITVPAPDAALSGLAARHGNIAAAYLGRVVIVARGVALDEIRLGLVTDLEPYRLGRDEMLGQVAERRRAQPRPELPPAQGLAAYRALIDAELRAHAQIRAAVDAGQVPRHRAADAAMIAALWDRAVSELADRARLGTRAAEDIMTSVLDQLTTLDEKAQWFTRHPRLREQAIDETLRHAVLGEAVTSHKAQKAWAGVVQYRKAIPVEALAPPLQSGARLATELLVERWEDEWKQWSLRR